VQLATCDHFHPESVPTPEITVAKAARPCLFGHAKQEQKHLSSPGAHQTINGGSCRGSSAAMQPRWGNMVSLISADFRVL